MMNKKVLSFLILLLSMMVWVESAIASDSTQEIKKLFKGSTPEEVENFDLSKGDSFAYEAAKMVVGTIGLINDIESSAGYDIALEAAPIVLDTFTKKIEVLNEMIDSKAWSINLRGKGTSAGAKKAVKTMTDQINKLKDKKKQFTQISNTVKSSTAKLTESWKLSNTGLKGAGAELKGKLGLGTVMTAVDVTMDLMQKQDRINKGSTETLENLNIALKVVESFGPPSIPFAKTPADVGRAIIDLQAALKQRNASLVNQMEIVNESMSFVNGEASLEAYVLRNFETKMTGGDINEAYESIRAEYMEHYSTAVENLYDIKAQLEKGKNEAWVDDAENMYSSMIAGVDIVIKEMVKNGKKIWNQNIGLDLAKALDDVEQTKQQVFESIDNLNKENETFDTQISQVTNTLETINHEFITYSQGVDSGSEVSGGAGELNQNEEPKETDGETGPQDSTLAEDKEKATELYNENVKLAQELEALLAAGKDTTAKEEQLDANGKKYHELRAAIQAADPGYDMPKYDNTYTVTKRFEKAMGAAGQKEELSGLKKELSRKAGQQVQLQKKQDAVNSAVNSKTQQNNAYSSQYNQLKLRENELQRQLSRIDQQLSESQGDSGSQYDMDKIQRVLEAVTYAANLYNKYNGDYSKLTPREIVGMKIRAQIVYGKASYRENLFRAASQEKSRIENRYAELRRNENNNNANREALENQKQELENQISQVLSSQRRVRNKMIKAKIQLRELEQDREEIVQQINENQESVGDMVSDILDSEKSELAQAQEESSGYRGSYSSISAQGWATTADIRGDGPAAVGMNLDVQNNDDGVFTGNFPVNSLHNSDGAVSYNYLSWGTWAATSPSQTYSQRDGRSTTLAGGQWVMGNPARNIPQTGSATYVGALSGDFRNAANVREAGVMGGTITLNANFQNSSLTGNINILKSNVPWANGSLRNGTIDPEYGSFNADIAAGSRAGIHGRFYGPDNVKPVEAGGSWHLTHDGGSSAAGIFRAKKQ